MFWIHGGGLILIGQNRSFVGLHVYHIAEPEVKAEIPPAARSEHSALMEMVPDIGAIARAVGSALHG